MFRSWGAIVSPIFAEIEGGRGQNGTFLGDFTWNDPYGQILDRAEIHTLNFQLQYLLQLYSKNLSIVLESFTGTL